MLLERAGYGSDEDDARRLVALVDGLLLAALVGGRPDPIGDAREHVSVTLKARAHP